MAAGRRICRSRPEGRAAQAVDLHQGLTRLAGAAENAIIDSFERGRALLADLIWGLSETWAQLYYVPPQVYCCPPVAVMDAGIVSMMPKLVWQLSDLLAYFETLAF